MEDLQLNIQAGTRFVSSEVQEVLDRVMFLIPNWKWIALIAGLLALFFIRQVLTLLLRKVKNAKEYFPQRSFMQFFFDQDIEKGLSWVLIALIGMMLVESLALTPNLEKYLTLFFKILLSFNLIRVVYMAAEAFGLSIQEWSKNTDTQIDDQLAPLATKTMKVLVILVGLLIVLQNFGVNVTALLAGLGIGGVALAFAAQDTVANVFGTITILLDSPFKLGDKIKLGDTEGTVEEVGFRSTRIRTYYNSLVTLPNSVVAKEKIDNMTDRQGWVRFRMTLGVTYEANPKQIAAFTTHLKKLLAEDKSIDTPRTSITFSGFGDSSLNILINFHYRAAVNEDETVRNQVYLEMIYELVQQHGLDFAFPTQTLIMQRGAAPKDLVAPGSGAAPVSPSGI